MMRRILPLGLLPSAVGLLAAIPVLPTAEALLGRKPLRRVPEKEAAPDPTLSRQQRRLAERQAAKAARRDHKGAR